MPNAQPAELSEVGPVLSAGIVLIIRLRAGEVSVVV